jgi:hypothetical protein
MPTVMIIALVGTWLADPLLEFHARVEAYGLLHRTVEAETPPRTVTGDPTAVALASDALADAIIAARPHARQGDIFTPDVTRYFEHCIRGALAGVSNDRRLSELYEGDDFRNLRAKVHARDPEGRVSTSVPPTLLWALPELPAELQYRIIGRDLALWDEHAALVVDFIPNAFPKQSFTRERSQPWPMLALAARAGT